MAGQRWNRAAGPAIVPLNYTDGREGLGIGDVKMPCLALWSSWDAALSGQCGFYYQRYNRRVLNPSRLYHLSDPTEPRTLFRPSIALVTLLCEAREHVDSGRRPSWPQSPSEPPKLPAERRPPPGTSAVTSPDAADTDTGTGTPGTANRLPFVVLSNEFGSTV